MSAVGGGTFGFPIGVNEVWKVRCVLPLTFTSTGGAKFQFTGPGTPTAVTITPMMGQYLDTTTGANGFRSEAPTAAFSTGFASYAAGGNQPNQYTSTTNGLPTIIEAVIANGANAGTVTLQVAQNSGAGTVVVGVGSEMRAERIN